MREIDEAVGVLVDRHHVVAAAAVFAAGLATALAPDAVAGKRRKKKRGRSKSQLVLQSVNVASSSSVPANEIVELVFSTAVDAATVNHAVIQIRGENESRTGYTRAAFGTLSADSPATLSR